MLANNIAIGSRSQMMQLTPATRTKLSPLLTPTAMFCHYTTNRAERKSTPLLCECMPHPGPIHCAQLTPLDNSQARLPHRACCNHYTRHQIAGLASHTWLVAAARFILGVPSCTVVPSLLVYSCTIAFGLTTTIHTWLSTCIYSCTHRLHRRTWVMALPLLFDYPQLATRHPVSPSKVIAALLSSLLCRFAHRPAPCAAARFIAALVSRSCQIT